MNNLPVMIYMIIEKAIPLVNQCDMVYPDESTGPDMPYRRNTKLRIEKVTYIDGAKVGRSSVPDREDNPTPEDREVKVDALLAGLIDLRVPVDILIVNVLLERVSEEAGPGGPKCVVQGLEPICEEDLS